MDADAPAGTLLYGGTVVVAAGLLAIALLSAGLGLEGDTRFSPPPQWRLWLGQFLIALTVVQIGVLAVSIRWHGLRTVAMVSAIALGLAEGMIFMLASSWPL